MSATRKNLRRDPVQLTLKTVPPPVASVKKPREKWLGKLIAYTISFLLLAWIGINASELVLSRDIPLVAVIQPMNHQEAMISVIDDFARLGTKTTALGDTNFNIPANLFIKGLGYKMEVTNERIIDGNYYTRTSKTQYIILNKDKDGRMGDVLIYAKSSWRTIPKSDKVTPGTIIELQTVNSITNSYTVKELKTLKSSDRYVATGSSARQVILFLDNGADSYTIVRAEQN
jgi:hypothetical protein